ncbi:hypothetical protein [Candidatus Poriferisodalis sp.]|uniref:hypothetical protein n=1 Tax=Candidatus Poriferisodalis sp. TaxID=3101277 RepID=UPI003B015614
MKIARRMGLALTTTALLVVLVSFLPSPSAGGQTSDESPLAIEITIADKIRFADSTVSTALTSTVLDWDVGGRSRRSVRPVALEADIERVSVTVRPSATTRVALSVSGSDEWVEGSPGQAVVLASHPTNLRVNIRVTPMNGAPLGKSLVFWSCHNGLGAGRVIAVEGTCIYLRWAVWLVADGYAVDAAVEQFNERPGWQVDSVNGRRVVGEHVPDNLTWDELEAEHDEIRDQPWAAEVYASTLSWEEVVGSGEGASMSGGGEEVVGSGEGASMSGGGEEVVGSGEGASMSGGGEEVVGSGEGASMSGGGEEVVGSGEGASMSGGGEEVVGSGEGASMSGGGEEVVGSGEGASMSGGGEEVVGSGEGASMSGGGEQAGPGFSSDGERSSQSPKGDVYVVNGWSPADVGLATLLASRTLGSSVLYTVGDELRSAIAEALIEFNPERVVIIGGVAVVTEEVQAAIAAAVPDAKIERIAGASRIETSVEVARLARSSS